MAVVPVAETERLVVVAPPVAERVAERVAETVVAAVVWGRMTDPCQVKVMMSDG